MQILFHRLTFYECSPTEYLGDSVLLGLRSLLGNTIVDSPKIEILYETSSEFVKQKKLFSLYGELSDVINRDEVQFFRPDKLIVALHHSTDSCEGEILKSLNLLKRKYDLSDRDIAVLDGQDSPKIYHDVAEKFLYFKRECRELSKRVLPISFSVPRKKILREFPGDKLAWCAINLPACCTHPNHYDTYIHQDETSYYEDYRRSYFAVTTKKGGWDCLRHYEILANGSLPVFINIENCPQRTCYFLNKEHLKEVFDLPGLSVASDKAKPEHHGDILKPGIEVDVMKFDGLKYLQLAKFLWQEQPSAEKVAKYLLEYLI